jgi:hypothetical protein
MEVPVTITTGTAFDINYGDTAILTVAFETAAAITYKASSTLYFYAVITEDTTTETVCFELTGGANPLPANTYPYVVPNTSAFTDAATATGKVYYTSTLQP